MSESTLTETAPAAAAHASKYTRNHPFVSTVLVNDLLTGAGSEKETRHIELSLDDGMAYTPGDAVGIIPENRREAVDESRIRSSCFRLFRALRLACTRSPRARRFTRRTSRRLCVLFAMSRTAESARGWPVDTWAIVLLWGLS